MIALRGTATHDRVGDEGVVVGVVAFLVAGAGSARRPREVTLHHERLEER